MIDTLGEVVSNLPTKHIPEAKILQRILPVEYGELMTHVCNQQFTRGELFRRISDYYRCWVDCGPLSNELLTALIWDCSE